jgi:hypothetical protein
MTTDETLAEILDILKLDYTDLASTCHEEIEMCRELIRINSRFYVNEALKAASEIADDWENSGELSPEILNAYPSENIV